MLNESQKMESGTRPDNNDCLTRIDGNEVIEIRRPQKRVEQLLN